MILLGKLLLIVLENISHTQSVQILQNCIKLSIISNPGIYYLYFPAKYIWIKIIWKVASDFIHFPSHIEPITIPCLLLGPSSIIRALKIKVLRLINFCGKMMYYLKFERIICPTFICTLFSCLDSLLTELISDLVCKLI